ncbi:MAG: hypothetical protein KAR19_09150 [Bacteroidales bacterium]|nr:hypothetical protein [Bacteroidales bacterium]
MKVLTIKSAEVLDEAKQTDVHHTFGMEHYTDYVFKPRGDRKYSATIVLEESSGVISNIESRSVSFPEHEFLIDDLDMEQNSIDRYRVKNGSIVEKLRSGWEWDK